MGKNQLLGSFLEEDLGSGGITDPCSQWCRASAVNLAVCILGGMMKDLVELPKDA